MKNKTVKNRRETIHVYSETDYESNDGMLTTIWGPSAWHFLHTISFNYPINPSEEDKKHYMEFVLNMKNILPCGKCRKNLIKNFKKKPLTMSTMESRAKFSKYVYDLHEVINAMLKKKSGLTYEMVRERYEHFRARCAIAPSLHSAMSGISGTKQRKSLEKRVRFSRKIGHKEKGCVVPLYGEKSKCILKVVPCDTKCDTFQIDKDCIKKRLVIN